MIQTNEQESSSFLSLQEILGIVDGTLENAEEVQSHQDRLQVSRAAPLRGSGKNDLAFFFSRAFEQELAQAAPDILITGTPFVGPLKALWRPQSEKTAIVSCEDPYMAMAVLTRHFAEFLGERGLVQGAGHLKGSGDVEVHPSATVDTEVALGPGVRVGPQCVVESGSVLEAGVQLMAGCVVGKNCRIGEQSVLFPHVTVYDGSQIGKRVRIHSGSVIGSDGFGYAPKHGGRGVEGHQKIHHLGIVVVEDDVEMGANSCVDRATFGETRIGAESKLDNLVHVGHNATLGKGVILCGGTCLAGNARIGDFAYIGGLTGIGNHVHVGAHSKVGALAMVTKDVPSGGTAVGNPQREYRDHFKAHALLSRLLSEKSKNKSSCGEE